MEDFKETVAQQIAHKQWEDCSQTLNRNWVIGYPPDVTEKLLAKTTWKGTGFISAPSSESVDSSENPDDFDTAAFGSVLRIEFSVTFDKTDKTKFAWEATAPDFMTVAPSLKKYHPNFELKKDNYIQKYVIRNTTDLGKFLDEFSKMIFPPLSVFNLDQSSDFWTYFYYVWCKYKKEAESKKKH